MSTAPTTARGRQAHHPLNIGARVARATGKIWQTCGSWGAGGPRSGAKLYQIVLNSPFLLTPKGDFFLQTLPPFSSQFAEGTPRKNKDRPSFFQLAGSVTSLVVGHQQVGGVGGQQSQEDPLLEESYIASFLKSCCGSCSKKSLVSFWFPFK